MAVLSLGINKETFLVNNVYKGELNFVLVLIVFLLFHEINVTTDHVI